MSERPARVSSNTANGVANLRAAHQLMDAEPRILDDPVVLRLIDPAVVKALPMYAEQLQSPHSRALRAHIVLRSRFAEDQLHDAVDRGIKQYVILGAGLDTFAYRQPAWAHALRIVEVDHPSSQDAKRERLANAGVSEPANLKFAPIDFEFVSLRDGLAPYVNFAEPAFFSWLGVTMYLTEPAIDAVLDTVSSFAAGTEIVLTFSQPADGASTDANTPSLAEHAARMGEPWLSYFTVESMEAKLRAHGFSRVEFLEPADADRRYFQHRTDNLVAPRRVNTVTARV